MFTTKIAPSRALGGLAWLSAAALLAGTAGCETSRDKGRDMGRAEGRPPQREGATVQTVRYEPGGARTVSTAMNTTTQTIDGVLRITKSLPREVTANAPFEYDITIENTSNLMLTNVWIREQDAASMSMADHGVGGFGGPSVQATPGAGGQFSQDQQFQQQAGQMMTTTDMSSRPVSQDLGGQQGMQQDMMGPRIQTAEQPLGEPMEGASQPGMHDQAGGFTTQTVAQPFTTQTVAQPMQQQGVGQWRQQIGQSGQFQQAGQFPSMQPVQAGPGMSGTMGVSAPRGFTQVPGGQNVREIQIGTLGPGERRTVTTTASVPQAGEFAICTSVAYTPMVCVTGTAIAPQLAITKIGPEFAAVGEPITYQITVTNTGVGPAHGVQLVDPLPGQMRTAEGQAEAFFDIGTLNAGQSRSFTIRTVPPEPGRYTNIARATTADGLEARAEAVTMVRAPQLTIEKIGPERQYTNIGATYEIRVTNTGDAPARNVVIEDLMPPGARFVEASANGNAVGNQVIWNLGTLGPGESRTVMTTLVSPTAGLFENCAIVRSDAVGPVRDCVATEFSGVAALLLEMVDQQDPVMAGGETVYTITVLNQGTAPAHNVGMSVELDEGQEFITADGASPFQAQGAANGNFAPLPTLPAGATANYRVVVRSNTPGDRRLRVSLTADELTQPVIEGESTRVVNPTP